MLALLNEEGQFLAQATNWQSLTVETSFTTVATEIQGSLATIAPGCKFIINDTIWNRDLRRPVYGPLGPQSWQQQEAMFFQGPWNQYRVVQGQIKFIPIPAAGQACYFEYVTENWATDVTGATGKSAFTADDDVPLLDSSLMVLGLIARWKQVKGFDYSADAGKYEQQLQNLMGRDASRPTLNMNGSTDEILPLILVPRGSWMQ